MTKSDYFLHFLLFFVFCDIIFPKGVYTVLNKHKAIITASFSVLFSCMMLFFSLNSAYAAAFESEKEIPRSVTIIIMIVLFIVTTVTAAFLTYRSRVKNLKEAEDKKRSDKTDS